MSATETWLLVAAVLAACACISHLAATRVPGLAFGGALQAAAVACIAVALMLALP